VNFHKILLKFTKIRMDFQLTKFFGEFYMNFFLSVAAKCSFATKCSILQYFSIFCSILKKNALFLIKNTVKLYFVYFPHKRIQSVLELVLDGLNFQPSLIFHILTKPTVNLQTLTLFKNLHLKSYAFIKKKKSHVSL
jgi:hypothetical protein